MAIKKVECYQATCDICKNEFVNGNDFSVFLDENQLLEELREDGWGMQNKKLVCTDCIDYESSLGGFEKIEPTKEKISNENVYLTPVKRGDSIFELLSMDGVLFVNVRTVKYISKNGRIICGFEPFTGLKPRALFQFNRTIRDSSNRGNHLNVFKTFVAIDKVINLTDEIQVFQKKYQKVTKRCITHIEYNYQQNN